MAEPKTGPVEFYNLERDGVTFSLLSTFKDCREKARLYLDGWSSRHSSMATTFGSLSHFCLQHIYDDVRIKKLTGPPGSVYTARLLESARSLWMAENPRADDETTSHFELSVMLIEAIIPLYCRHWYGDDFSQMQWEKLETVFGLPITVKDKFGREHKTVLRGKMDGTFKYKGRPRIRLLETKNKSRISEENLSDMLPYELQTNLYLSVLRKIHNVTPGGVLLNVIRRPNLRQRSSESLRAFGDRIIEDIRARPDWYFLRLESTVTKQDMDNNDAEIEDLISDFVLWHIGEAGHYKNSNHCENKYGTCQYLRVCSRGDYSNLFKRTVVFRELEDV